MNLNFTRPPGFFLRKSYGCMLLLIGIFLNLNSFAQTSISTANTFTNDATAGTVTFNFQNTNSYPVIITNVEGILSEFGSNTVELWYKTTAISGSPGNINTANGWTLLSTQSVSGIANTTNTSTQPFFTNISLTIPANTTYGIAVSAYVGTNGTQRIGSAATAVSLNNGSCNFLSGPNIGYAAAAPSPAAPDLASKGWLGKITFMPGNNCTGTPGAATISGPQNICANALFSLTATGYSFGTGLNYQWQRYNTTTSAWEDITGANTPDAYTSTGITASTQFRLKTTCSSTSTQSFSNTATVGIGTGLPAGTYTINKNAPSTNTNFISLSAAAAAMKCGISGLVNLNVVPGSGPYTEKVVFGNVPGTSPANQIRLNGNGEVLQYEITSTPDVGVLTLDGTKYMTVDSMVIKTLSQANGIGVVMLDTAKYDSIMHCFIDVRSLNIVGNGGTGGISLSNYYFSTSTGNSEAIYIGYNYVLGGTGAGGPYYGIMDGYYNNVNNYNSDTGNVIVHNTVENFVYGGIMTNGNNGAIVGYNDIHRTNKTASTYFVGILCYAGWNNGSSTTGTNQNIKIIGNRIHNPSNTNNTTAGGFIGIELDNWYYNNTQAFTTNTLVANNAIYNVDFNNNTAGYVYGIYYGGGTNNNTNSDQTKIYHNTIDLSAVNSAISSNVNGIFYYDNYFNNTQTEDVHVKNNLITITGNQPSPKYGFYYSDYNNQNNLNLDAQRNNVYLNTTPSTNQYYCNYDNINYATLANFQAAFPTQEIGSLSVNPQYTSPSTGDYTPLNYALAGNGVNVQADVPQDILGRNRSVAPTPGAFEITVDAGVNALAAPVGTFCSSVKQVKVSVKNYGILNISSIQVNWSLNGVLQPPVTAAVTLAPNTTTIVSLGDGLFMPGTPVTIKAWTVLNGQPDGISANDTLTTITQSSTSVPINIGPDDSICAGNTLTLDAGYPGSVYIWDNYTTAQLRTIQNAGTYYVRVTALDGCIGVDTMKLSIRALPVVDLGPDREICEGSVTTLDAGHPGASYLWDDGSTMQTRTVDTAGVYEANVTDIYGCTGTGDIDVIMKDMPLVDGINATHADSGLYTFYPLEPRYVISYKWDFGDGSPEQMGYMVQHQYAHNGIYTVTLYLEGECTGLIIKNVRTVDVFNALGGDGTGINNTRFEGDIALYPNPADNKLMVENKSEANMNRVVVYSALGQVIIDQKADGSKRHQLNTAGLASGLYSIRIETDKGSFIQKFEVRR